MTNIKSIFLLLSFICNFGINAQMKSIHGIQLKFNRIDADYKALEFGIKSGLISKSRNRDFKPYGAVFLNYQLNSSFNSFSDIPISTGLEIGLTKKRNTFSLSYTFYNYKSYFNLQPTTLLAACYSKYMNSYNLNYERSIIFRKKSEFRLTAGAGLIKRLKVTESNPYNYPMDCKKATTINFTVGIIYIFK